MSPALAYVAIIAIVTGQRILDLGAPLWSERFWMSMALHALAFIALVKGAEKPTPSLDRIREVNRLVVGGAATSSAERE